MSSGFSEALQAVWQPAIYPAVQPDAPVWVIGDIHGRADLLSDLLGRIAAIDLRAGPAHIVIAGDAVDRGPESGRTLSILRRLVETEKATYLAGNHEWMMVDFLAAEIPGGRWLSCGGMETVVSFGLPTEGAPWRIRDRMRRMLGADGRAFLEQLPIRYDTGNLLISHAGADPQMSIDRQDASALVWGQERCLTLPRTDGHWIAHGHWPRKEPEVREGRIWVDTGAVKTDRLTAARIEDGTVRFLTT